MTGEHNSFISVKAEKGTVILTDDDARVYHMMTPKTARFLAAQLIKAADEAESEMPKL